MGYYGVISGGMTFTGSMGGVRRTQINAIGGYAMAAVGVVGAGSTLTNRVGWI